MALTRLNESPSLVVYVSIEPPLYRLMPRSNEPTQRLPSRDSHITLTRSLESPSSAESVMNFPSRRRIKPPPFVPIQMLPSLSSKKDRRSDVGRPFRVVKYP